MMKILALITALIFMAAPALADAPLWRVDEAQSRLGFIADQSGGDVEGRFESWRAEIRFDPEDLSASSVSVEIDMASVATGSSDQERNLKSEDLFHVEAYPTGRFQSLEITSAGGEAYEMRGELTLRETTREVVIPFTLAIEDGSASAEGGVTINRLDYGVGQGDWRDTSMVADPVEIVFEIEATLASGESAQ